MDSARPSTLIVSVQRALRLLEVVSGRPRGAPAKVVARAAGLPLGTTYHLLRTLAYEGYLRRLDDGRWVLGDRVGDLVVDGRPQAALARARPALAALRDRAGASPPGPSGSASWRRPLRPGCTASPGGSPGRSRSPSEIPALPASGGRGDDAVEARTPLEVAMADDVARAIVDALRTVHDPCCAERGISVVDMGLVRSVATVPAGGNRGEGGDGGGPGDARVELLLTSGWCPFAVHLVDAIRERVETLPQVGKASVEIVWDDPWTAERLSDDARRKLRFLPEPREVRRDR